MSTNLVPFQSWPDVLAYAQSGQPLYYSAPMDRYPARLMPGGNAPFTYKAQARSIKIWPAGSVGRGRNRTSDPFTADAGHLDRFSRPEEARAQERGTMAAKRGATKLRADFGDEESVHAEMARALNVDPEDLQVERSHLTDFGAGDVYRVESGSKEWSVVENSDVMRDLALAIVKQDLEEDPSMFNKSFIEQHINTDRLRRDLESDVQNMAEEDLREMSDRRFWKTAEDYIDVPEENEDGEMPDPEDYISEVAEKMTEERLRDPMEYLEEIYGDEAPAKAIEIAGIDIDAAAEEAVDSDGPEHFVARYDGNSHETSSGFVYWRDN